MLSHMTYTDLNVCIGNYELLQCNNIIIIIIIIKSLFQAMPIKVRCTIAQKSAQIVGARVHVCIITKLRKHTDMAKKGLHI